MNFILSIQYKFLLPLLCVIFLFACNKKPLSPDISQTILSLKETGELVTAEYTISKVIRASDDQTWYKLGDRKILINCDAYLKAGISLQDITKDNFQIQNDTIITVALPHAKLFSLQIPPDKIKIAYQEIGTFRDAFSANEREQLVAQAEPQIKALVASLGILQTAESNGATFIKHLFQQTGFKQVVVIYQ